LDISYICWFRVIRVLFCVFGVFIVEEVDGVEAKGSGDTTMVDVLTLLDAFLNTSLISVCFTNEALFWQKAEVRVLGLLFSSVGLSDDTLKEFYCMFPSCDACMLQHDNYVI
jgi:hypothetical protein